MNVRFTKKKRNRGEMRVLLIFKVLSQGNKLSSFISDPTSPFGYCSANPLPLSKHVVTTDSSEFMDGEPGRRVSGLGFGLKARVGVNRRSRSECCSNFNDSSSDRLRFVVGEEAAALERELVNREDEPEL